MVVNKECESLFKAFNKQGFIDAREEDEVIELDETDHIIPDGEHQTPALQHFISASQVLQQHDELLCVLRSHNEPELSKFHTLAILDAPSRRTTVPNTVTGLSAYGLKETSWHTLGYVVAPEH